MVDAGWFGRPSHRTAIGFWLIVGAMGVSVSASASASTSAGTCIGAGAHSSISLGGDIFIWYRESIREAFTG